MSDAIPSSYDDLPYESQFFTMTHPDRMATMARLHGLESPPVESCRVLELGCSNGGNLLPMAQTLPNARFVGIDLSPRQVADGQATLRALGSANVALKALSILDVGDDFGTFDYIICHGVYSWVPAAVREKILSICAHNLAPNGVAYVSYNTYPGWHLRGMVREMLLYHTQEFREPLTRVRQARAFLDFLIKAAPDAEGDYVHVIKEEADLLGRESDTYLFHEHLEEQNHPVYFHEFVALAEGAGLQYLAPARFSSIDAHVKPEVRPILDQWGTDRVRREQYLDFIRSRTFRQSLLCRAGVPVRESPRSDVLHSLRITALARPASENPDVSSDAPEEFRSITGERATTNRPSIKAALVSLYNRWPRSATLDELWEETRKRPRPDGEDRNALAESLMQAHLSNLVGLHGHEPPIAFEAGDRPLASSLARLQAEAAGTLIVSLRHRNVALDEFDGLVLRLLDGTRDRPALVARLAEWVADGTFSVQQGEEPVHDPARVRALLTEALEPSLNRIAGQALLLAAP